jgi:hypothetical protein
VLEEATGTEREVLLDRGEPVAGVSSTIEVSGVVSVAADETSTVSVDGST